MYRRVYHVHSPLALWHMDGNYKLIRLDVVFVSLSGDLLYLNVLMDSVESQYTQLVIQIIHQQQLLIFLKADSTWSLPSQMDGGIGVENRDFAKTNNPCFLQKEKQSLITHGKKQNTVALLFLLGMRTSTTITTFMRTFIQQRIDFLKIVTQLQFEEFRPQFFLTYITATSTFIFQV